MAQGERRLIFHIFNESNWILKGISKKSWKHAMSFEVVENGGIPMGLVSISYNGVAWWNKQKKACPSRTTAHWCFLMVFVCGNCKVFPYSWYTYRETRVDVLNCTQYSFKFKSIVSSQHTIGFGKNRINNVTTLKTTRWLSFISNTQQ